MFRQNRNTTPAE